MSNHTPRFRFGGLLPVIAGAVMLAASACAQTTSTAPAQPPQQPAVSAPAPSAAPANGAPLSATLSHDFYSRGLPDKLVLEVRIFTPPLTAPPATAAPAPAAAAPSVGSGAPEPALRPPLNLALVIDSSGSMNDAGKFEHAARAVALVVENLSERDIFSLIAFNEGAAVLSPAGAVVNKEFLRHRMSDIGPQGWTNLSAGLLEAFAQIDAGAAGPSATAGQTKRVIVLTDGQANRGITDSPGLRKLVTSAKARGISVSAMGVGADFDEKLLTALTEAGGGRYSYARAAEDIPTAMRAELAGFLAVRGQNARLEITAQGAKISRIFGRILPAPVEHYAIELGDLREGERGGYEMELTPNPTEFNDGAGVAVDLTLTMDLPAEARRERLTARASAAYSSDRAKVKASEREHVVLCAAAQDALEKAEQAIEGLDSAKAREVAANFQTLHDRLRRVALESRDQDLLNHAFMLKHFMEELSAASQAGLLHGHDEARRQLTKEADYQRYLLEHHRK